MLKICCEEKDMHTQHLHDIKAWIESLQGVTPGMLSFAVTLNARKDKDALDLVLDSRFTSWESLTAYLESKEHIAVVERVKPFKPKRAVVDYEEYPR